jgi:hypothetical protein
MSGDTLSDNGACNAAFKSCIVIPHFNHPTTIADVVATLKPFGLPCFVVDDASGAPSRPVLDALAASEAQWLTLLRHDVNRGKGAAVITGCDAALAAGFTHAVQIDADGQHAATDIPKLLDLARKHPHALVTGTPIYDQSVPRSRFYGRYVTHVWVWINTLSLRVPDSMCGLRVYPLAVVSSIWRSTRIGQRMDFDTEIIVRMVWAGLEVLGMPTRVTYPADGVSHFDVWRDNVRISSMHARLFVGMLWRSPYLIARRIWRGVKRRSAEVAA